MFHIFVIFLLINLHSWRAPRFHANFNLAPSDFLMGLRNIFAYHYNVASAVMVINVKRPRQQIKLLRNQGKSTSNLCPCVKRCDHTTNAMVKTQKCRSFAAPSYMQISLNWTPLRMPHSWHSPFKSITVPYCVYFVYPPFVPSWVNCGLLRNCAFEKGVGRMFCSKGILVTSS